MKGAEQRIEYDVLPQKAVPASAKIRKTVIKHLFDQQCGPSEENTSTYQGVARLDEVNGRFVRYKMFFDAYCGGAHPNGYIAYATFDSKSGQEVDMNQEIPVQGLSYDSPQFNAYQNRLARLVLANLKTTTFEYDNNCFEDATNDEDKIEFILGLNPYIAAPKNSKTLILTIMPPHVGAACMFSTELDVSVFSKNLKPNGKLIQWLN